YIESMAKLRMYWLSEIRKELEYYGKDLTKEELRACANMATIPVSEVDIFNINDDIFDDDESYIMNQHTNFTLVNSGTFVASETKLNIEDIADLTLPFFNNNNVETYCENFKPQSKPTSSKGHGNMDFEASNVVDEVLGLEDDNNQL
ncbi:15456_t:CDS:1, partial [Cetraspora pellucida]